MAELAVITGASTGIGLELAKQFAAAGYDLLLVARKKEVLDKVAELIQDEFHITAHTLACDLSAPHAALSIQEFTTSSNLNVSVLINNAGFGANGHFDQIDPQTSIDMVQVNITALVELSRLYLPAMLEAKRGGILNVASTAAFVPGPYMACYYATKAFVLSFSEALSLEVQGRGVTVSCLCPGATATEFQGRANMVTSKLFNSPLVMTAAEVARLGYEGFRSGKSVVITGPFNQASTIAAKFLPRRLAARLVGDMQRPS